MDSQVAARRWSGLLVGVAMLSGSCVLEAQQSGAAAAIPDAQVEANVLRALGANATLKSQPINSSTVYGVVTLSGHVPDEATRVLAENTIARTAGVTKVVDQLTLAPTTAASGATGDQAGAQPTAEGQSSPSDESNPTLQSDGTYAQPNAPGQDGGTEQAAGSNGPGAAYPTPQPEGDRRTLPEYGQNPAGDNGAAQGEYGPPQGASRQGPYGPAEPGSPQASYPPPTPYGQAGPGSYGSGYAPARAEQAGGQRVTVPSGATLVLRVNSGVDSKHTPVGTPFSATVVQDVVENGYVAIPRGAMVQGTVVDATSAGHLKGRAELGLQLTTLTLGGSTYPLSSDVWSRTGGDKANRTVGSAIGLGLLGALVGGVAGGGAGAAIGAGAGAGAGVGASAASDGGVVFVPAEAVLSFRLQAPLDLTTVSQAELNRLAYNVPPPAYGPPRMMRRFPAYGRYGPYGPGPYAYPPYYRVYPY